MADNDKNHIHSTDLELYRYLFQTVWKKRKKAYTIIGITTGIMLVYVLVMPQSFTSTVSILPPQKDQNPLSISSMLQGGGSSLPMFNIGSSLGLGGKPSDLFVEILGSESVLDSLIIHEHLDVFFSVEAGASHRFAFEPLRKATDIQANKNGVIRVSVSLSTGFVASTAEVDSIKRLAARIANQYVVWLDRINREKLVSRARNSRTFIEHEISRTRRELDSAFDKLVEYQEQHQSAYIDKQMESALDAASSLRGKIAETEIELGLKKQDFSARSRVISKLEAEIDQLRQQYNAISIGVGKSEQDYYVPFAKIPAAARDLANYLRDVKTLEQVIVFLSQQYYQDKVQEARDTPTVQVLDIAVPAIQRTSPKRAMWLIITVFFSLLASVLYIMVSEFFLVRKTSRDSISPLNTN